jgi:hypothetical protein
MILDIEDLPLVDSKVHLVVQTSNTQQYLIFSNYEAFNKLNLVFI